MLVCELLVKGLGVKACANRTPLFAKSSNAGSLNLVVAVTVDMVGAQGIDGNQKNIGRGRCPTQARHQKQNQRQPHKQLV